MHAPATADDLGLLLATEQRLERALAEVKVEAERLRAEAVREAAVADEEAAASVEVSRKRASAELAVETAARIAAIEAAARAEIERWYGLDGEPLAREAQRLARRLVELAAEAP